MHASTPSSHRTRLLGCVLALLALLSLHLHGLHGYRTDMLFGADVCTAADATAGTAPQPGAALMHGVGCDLCCAQAPAFSAGNGGAPSLVPAPALRVPAPGAATLLATPHRWAHPARGPPA